MRTLLMLVIAQFLQTYSSAECENMGLSVFPNGHTIKQNSIFVVEGYALSQRIVIGLNKKYPVYLKSGDKRVNLFVKEICVGKFGLTQAILMLEKPLEAGLDFEFLIDSLPDTESLGRYNKERTKIEGIIFTVITGIDKEKPILISKPKEINKSFANYGCGPAMNVNFDFLLKDSSEVLIKTTVKNIKSGLETTYYLQTQNNLISVGHDMCAGEFDYDESKNYEVEFSFMDASGNLTAWKGDRIKFTSP